MVSQWRLFVYFLFFVREHFFVSKKVPRLLSSKSGFCEKLFKSSNNNSTLSGAPQWPPPAPNHFFLFFFNLTIYTYRTNHEFFAGFVLVICGFSGWKNLNFTQGIRQNNILLWPTWPRVIRSPRYSIVGMFIYE